MSGSESLKGFDYQISYSVLKTLELLISERANVDFIKFESLTENEEDFNIFWKDGTTEFVQIKKRNEGYNWTPSDVKQLIQKYAENYNEKSKYRFVTNGQANPELNKLKKKTNKGKKPESKLCSAFYIDNLDKSKQRKIMSTMTFETLYFPSNDDDKPAKRMKEQTLRLLLGESLYITNSVEIIYDQFWRYIFEHSKSSNSITMADLIDHMTSIGVLVVDNNEWLKLPNNDGFVGRESELTDLMRCIDTGQCISIKGISGIGKSQLASTLARKLISQGREVCWFSFNDVLDRSKFIKILSKYMHEQGDKQISAQLLNSQEELQTIGIIQKYIESKNILLFIDSFEKATSSIRRMIIDIFVRVSRSKNPGSIILTTINSEDIYSEVELKLKQIVEFNLAPLNFESFSKLMTLDTKVSNKELTKLYEAVGGFPVTTVFLKNLIVGNEIENSDIDLLSDYSVEKRNKWVFDKVYNTFEDKYKELIKSISIFDYSFNHEDVERINPESMTNYKYELQTLSSKSVLIFEGNSYYMHDTVRALALDQASSNYQMKLHEIQSTFLHKKMLVENEYEREIHLKWGYHIETMNSIDKTKDYGLDSFILNCNDEDISNIWGVLRFGYPFVFDERNIDRIDKRLNELVDLGQINIDDDNDNEYILKSREYTNDEWFYLEYRVLSRGLPHSMGYVPNFDFNYSIMNQPNTICPWEHCIEFMPLEYGDLQCPIFGHNCPSGLEQADECKEYRNSIDT